MLSIKCDAHHQVLAEDNDIDAAMCVLGLNHPKEKTGRPRCEYKCVIGGRRVGRYENVLHEILSFNA